MHEADHPLHKILPGCWEIGMTGITLERLNSPDRPWEISALDVSWLQQHQLINCLFRTRKQAFKAATAALAVSLPRCTSPHPVSLIPLGTDRWTTSDDRWDVKRVNGNVQYHAVSNICDKNGFREQLTTSTMRSMAILIAVVNRGSHKPVC